MQPLALLTLEEYRPHIFRLEIPFINLTLEPRFYGLFYAIAIIMGFRVLLHENKRRKLGLSEDNCMNMVLIMFVCGLFGGRFFQVFMSWSHWYADGPFWKVFAIWEGGLAIHGGIIGGVCGVWLITRIYKLKLMEMLDIGSIGLILGQAIGRWGNFTNGELGGYKTDSFLGVVFPPGSPIDRYAQGHPVHPTMIYESILNFMLFGLLWQMRKMNLRPGTLGATYLIGYGIIRSAVTPIRNGDNYFEFMGEIIKAPYVSSLVMFVIAAAMIGTLELYKKPEPQPVMAAGADSGVANTPKSGKNKKKKRK